MIEYKCQIFVEYAVPLHFISITSIINTEFVAKFLATAFVEKRIGRAVHYICKVAYWITTGGRRVTSFPNSISCD